jgi:Domain of unknown function (DUF4136)
MSRMLAATLMLVTLPVAASAQKFGQPIPVDLEYDHATDFSRYKTFAWAPFQEPAPNAANHVRITRAVERELEAKGLTKVPPGEASLLARYQAKLEKKFRGKQTQSESPWQPSNKRTIVNIDSVKIGTMILDLWDAGTKDLVWQARLSMPAPSPDRVEEAINKSVKRLMEEYPPKPEPQQD